MYGRFLSHLAKLAKTIVRLLLIKITDQKKTEASSNPNQNSVHTTGTYLLKF